MPILKSPSPTNLDLTALDPLTWTDEGLADAADVRLPLQQAATAIDAARGSITVNATDTTFGNLEEKLIVNTGLSLDNVNAGAGSLQRRINLDSKLVALLAYLSLTGKLQLSGLDTTSYTEGHLLAVGAGNSVITTPNPPVLTPLDQRITAGEPLAYLDLVYRKLSDSKWYKVDVDASPIKLSERIAIVVESAGIALNDYGQVRLMGLVSGFSGLIAGQPVYASATAGSITQTRPDPSLGGAQVVVVYIGEAISNTVIALSGDVAIHYMKRALLANDATLSIEHHPDPQGFLRQPKAYLSNAGVESPLVIGRWSGGSRDLAVRYDDGLDTNSNTQTSFQNVTGSTADITCILELSV